MTDEAQKRITRILVGLLVLVVVAMVFSWLHPYLTTGTIKVSTSGKNNVVQITKINSDGSNSKPSFSKQAQNQLSLRLKPGQYKLTASSQSFSTNQIITVKSRKHLDIKLGLKPTSTPEPVYGGDADAMAIDQSQMLFINPSTEFFSRIDSQDQLSVVDNSLNLQRIHWANTSFGVAVDEDDNLYTVTNGTVSPLALPFQVNGSPSMSFDVSSSGTVYVSNGQDVYKETAGSSFSKVYSSGSNYNTDVTAGPGGVAIIEKSSGNGTTSVVLVNNNGATVRKSLDADQVAWSPNGKYLAVLGGGSSSAIYNSSLNRVAVLPNSDLNNIVWQNNDTVLYDANNMLWSYSLSSQQSVAIANLQPGSSLSEMVVDSNARYVYFVSTVGSQSEVDRVGLYGQKALSFVYQLDVFFPKIINISQPCTVNYINFAGPSLQVVGAPTTPVQVCQQAIQTELYSDQLDTSGLKINYSTESLAAPGADF